MVELWTAVGEHDSSIERAERALGGRWAVRVVDVIEDAASTWRDFASPMWVADDLLVMPAWQELPDDVAAAGVPRIIWIEPGGAFGLGDHPTTLLSLRALRRMVVGDCDVLDVGCGTGVLAIASAVLQRRPVRAIDVASVAVEATADNARRNGVGDRVAVDASDLADIEGDFDVVIANILAPTLVSLAADLRRVTRPGGRLVVSGILDGAHQHVLDALAPMLVERTEVIDGWACVELRFGPAER